jgi:hypothetical protein
MMATPPSNLTRASGPRHSASLRARAVASALSLCRPTTGRRRDSATVRASSTRLFLLDRQARTNLLLAVRSQSCPPAALGRNVFFAYRVPFLQVLSCHSLGHPARCFSRARRELRGSAFPVPSTTNLPRRGRAAAALKGEISCGAFPKSAACPWERGTLHPNA